MKLLNLMKDWIGQLFLRLASPINKIDAIARQEETQAVKRYGAKVERALRKTRESFHPDAWEPFRELEDGIRKDVGRADTVMKLQTYITWRFDHFPAPADRRQSQIFQCLMQALSFSS